MAENLVENQRKILYNRLPNRQPLAIDKRTVNVFSKMVAEKDAKEKKPMDPYILQHIEGPNKEGVQQYAKTYKKFIEKTAGRRKNKRRLRKTRRVKK
jgi:hypothetical protein